MRQVTKEEFFAAMNPLDVHPSIKTRFPFTSDWELRDRTVVGRSVERYPDGLTVTDWYLP